MSSNTNLLAETANATWSFEKTTPFPATQGFYRSRIYTTDFSINSLVAACDQLFGLVTVLDTIEYPDDSDKLLQDLAHEIHSFEHLAQIAGYSSNIIIAARYAICSLLDEAIAATPWGQTKRWQEKSLLSLFHHENYGGSRFFSIIDRALENITNNLHLIELLYLCLNFGFTGKYKDTANGQNELIGITNKLYQIIGQYNSVNPKTILIHDKKPPLPQIEIIPETTATSSSWATTINTKKLIWVTASVALIIGGLSYFGINLRLNHKSKPIYVTLEQIAKTGEKT